MFGFSTKEIINQNIDKIIPKLIGIYHNNLLINYLSNQHSTGDQEIPNY